MGFTTLRRILAYHVSATLAYSPGVDHATLKTLEGASLDLKLGSVEWHGRERKVLKINGNESVVWFPDVPVANGVVHIISSVLIPPKELAEIQAAAEKAFPGDELEGADAELLEVFKLAEQKGGCPMKMWKEAEELEWEA
jgi:hypothetical protein